MLLIWSDKRYLSDLETYVWCLPMNAKWDWTTNAVPSCLWTSVFLQPNNSVHSTWRVWAWCHTMTCPHKRILCFRMTNCAIECSGEQCSDHPWCVTDKSYHKALLIVFGCDGITDHASWNEVFNYCPSILVQSTRPSGGTYLEQIAK